MLNRNMNDDIMVMIVDDQTTMRRIVRQMLSQIGTFNVIEAKNGLEALKILNDNTQQKNPDIIISDLHMDEMDGIEFCNKIRLSKKLDVRTIPVLMLTGENDDFILRVSKQVGAFKILSKPVSAPELKEHISSALGYKI